MPRPSQRQHVLDAYLTLAVTHGPGATTLEAVAAAAGVSRSGLLYHFASKEALLDGLVARTRELNSADIALARRRAAAGTESVAHYYLRTSRDEPDHEPDLFRTMAALLKLSGTEERAAAAAREVMAMWRAALAEEAGDELTADLIAAVGDGIYLRAIAGQDSELLARDLDAVLARLRPGS